MKRASPLLLSLGLALTGCGDGSSSTGAGGSGGSGGSGGQGGDTASKCTPGETAECACPGGKVGTQVCEEDGQSFSSCDCTGGGGAGGGTGGTGGIGGNGGAGGGALCPDPNNPMFGSCVEAFLAGCYEPDLTGTCTDENGTVTWSDGSRYVTNGPNTGLYGPGDAAPCIAVTFGQGTITATKGAETLLYETDQATMTAIITCPDASKLTATFDQVTEFNRCVGVNCPL